jgi:hypothetical protein
VWSTDSNGNYASNLIGLVPGNSTALESFETLFNQDLNGDGTIGVPSGGSVTAGVRLAGKLSTDNFHFASGDDSGATGGFPNYHTIDQTVPSTPAGVAANVAYDSFVFAPDRSPISTANFAPSANATPLSETAFTTIHGVSTGIHEDVPGNAVVETTHGSHCLAHNIDFYLI